MSFYTFARAVVKSVLAPLYRVETIGVEHIPKEGSVLICANHISNFDPPMIGITCPRPVHFMAKAELFRVPLLKQIVQHLHAFPVRRGMGDREALRTGLALLKEKKVLGLFPEGTRSRDGKLGKGLAGAGFFALRSEAAVVPCAIIGPYRLFHRVKVVYGPPIDFAPLRERKASADEATALIMEHIRQLLEAHQ
ncbi:1-acyl-sn-glycerol-3-phosphate acyltransferase [Thermolongibacillus altinsuensis]|uniref:1-acyl-sn-glycerol-3-phosphate acyltransferase n=1 Tax=Thermolongibacillus altinsuensis TaxID=575256 RepID=A0A4R1QKE8_9BACL|nr:lysophospholipid acyltransferase family protein [Thermolongibacillus altinsuensis]TCL53151.1 1-acyl-sn-glycerol-3-phosphate acyltransferase [Thermolongibacillus altinsuensis]GMB07854.1 1-acyl-sn-glycerol-3-phosphate acyltransferase [Thermolongibacillus altinsuensis]